MILLSLTGRVQAHSLDYVENQLAAKGSFFQGFVRDTPDFILSDSNGNDIAPDYFSGKIVVLYFADAECTAGCEAQTKRLAEIQSMVNISPMRDLVRFVAIVSGPEKTDLDTAWQSVDPVNWTTLFSQPDTVRQLMSAFGPEGVNPVSDIVTHIIGVEGRWRADFYGLEFQKLDMVVYLNALFNFGIGVTDSH